jgi:hypothetical protein
LDKRQKINIAKPVELSKVGINFSNLTVSEVKNEALKLHKNVGAFVASSKLPVVVALFPGPQSTVFGCLFSQEYLSFFSVCSV